MARNSACPAGSRSASRRLRPRAMTRGSASGRRVPRSMGSYTTTAPMGTSPAAPAARASSKASAIYCASSACCSSDVRCSFMRGIIPNAKSARGAARKHGEIPRFPPESPLCEPKSGGNREIASYPDLTEVEIGKSRHVFAKRVGTPARAATAQSIKTDDSSQSQRGCGILCVTLATQWRALNNAEACPSGLRKQS